MDPYSALINIGSYSASTAVCWSWDATQTLSEALWQWLEVWQCIDRVPYRNDFHCGRVL